MSSALGERCIFYQSIYSCGCVFNGFECRHHPDFDHGTDPKHNDVYEKDIARFDIRCSKPTCPNPGGKKSVSAQPTNESTRTDFKQQLDEALEYFELRNGIPKGGNWKDATTPIQAFHRKRGRPKLMYISAIDSLVHRGLAEAERYKSYFMWIKDQLKMLEDDEKEADEGDLENIKAINEEIHAGPQDAAYGAWYINVESDRYHGIMRY